MGLLFLTTILLATASLCGKSDPKNRRPKKTPKVRSATKKTMQSQLSAVKAESQKLEKKIDAIEKKFNLPALYKQVEEAEKKFAQEARLLIQKYQELKEKEERLTYKLQGKAYKPSQWGYSPEQGYGPPQN